MKRIAPVTLALTLALFLLAGCTTVRQTFHDQDPQHVWTALIAVAETPDYSSEDPNERWTVDENHVAVFDEERRIEIYRRLDRMLYRPGAKPIRQDRTWRFQILLENLDPPTVAFISRGWGIPQVAQWEARKYYADVWDILGGPPMEEPGD
ncbi:MAG: hypothetical protein JSV91_16000 [Phycisphaerales bacterium]|nr:MAG: hypothetical protein JSV91_16000 [Phycisphaerales bacterium]